MNKFYFTFGCGQQFEGGYFVIEAEEGRIAREKMFKLFGRKWSMQYNNREDAGVGIFNLFEVTLEMKEEQDRVRGQLNDLLNLEDGLTENEIKWLEIYNDKMALNCGARKAIDDIYVRRMF